MMTICSEGNAMAHIIEFRTAQSRPPAALANKCCSRCGADVWHLRENGEICCADCDEVCTWQLQLKNEH